MSYEIRFGSTSSLFAILYEQYVVRLRFLTLDVFNECFFYVQAFANTQNTSVRGAENPREIQQHILQSEKVEVRSAVHGNGVVGLNYFSDVKVRAVDYYRMLDTFCPVRRSKFPTGGCFPEVRSCPHITNAVCSLLH